MRSKKLLSAAALGLFLSTAGIASAQSTTTTTTPGVPSTGVGDAAAMNALILGGSALLAITGALYLTRRKALR